MVYRRIYEGICGRHPYVRPWHFQWLDTFYLYADLRNVLSEISGRILDAGCGDKPYREWFGTVTEYVGLDVLPGPQVDIVVASDGCWPLPDRYFDALLSSQVLEHVEHLELTLSEMNRVLRPGGTMVLSFPFLYNEHGIPFDFQRFTAYRARQLLPGYEVVRLERQGGIGSTLVLLWLNWVEQSLNASFPTRICKALLLPIWVPVSLVLNLLGLLFDCLDRTGAYYSNLMVVLRKDRSVSGTISE
jgi:SAM-dependent methyltransferase